MIAIYCKTNLDLSRVEKWPTELPAVPRVGDNIESMHLWERYTVGRERPDIRTRLRLRVCAVTWTPFPSDKQMDVAQAITYEYMPVIELHLPSYFENIKEFKKWYERITGGMIW